jgi:predicted Rossmann fold nucleotide-binding protein DprA/Smf involved in DNA uptake
MNLSPSAQATLLMTSYFGKVANDGPRPLSIVEWGRFAQWLKEQKRTPDELLTPAANDLLDGWRDKKVDKVRITQLLSRGHALALAVEKWQRAGLWIITRADPDYPVQLKARLKTLSPPVLFGCGERRLLNGGGLAVIGSRNANDEDLAFTQKVGFKAASKGISIVSGGARGVDEAAMFGAVNAGGSAIGIVADSLLRSATSKKWRKAVMDGHLALVSPFYPESGFSVGNAMARNKYIYCLAESSLVIHSGTRGGTLNGAEENLQRNWVPLWVKPTQDADAANSSLVAKGGRWCEGDIQALDVNSLFVPIISPAVFENDVQTDMFAMDDDVSQILRDDLPEKGNKASDPIGSDAQNPPEHASVRHLT